MEFNYHGSSYPGATYFKTISLRGPEFFAIVNDTWHRYISATDIKFGRMNIMITEPKRATTEEESQAYFDMASQEANYGVENED